MRNPLVSVLMPVYNGEKYINEAIESILNQSLTNFEFIIMNDGSSDATEDRIQSWGDSRIRYYKSDINCQIVSTLNKGIELAKGKYIARMDADDISLPERLERQIDLLERAPDVDVCGTWLKVFGDTEENIWKYPLSHENIKTAMLFSSSMAHPTVVMKTDFFNNFKYKEEYNKAEDYALWVESILYKKFVNIPNVLYCYRIHGKQTDKKKQVEISNQIRRVFLKEINCDLKRPDFDDFIKIIGRQDIDLHRIESIFNMILSANKEFGHLNQTSLQNFLGDKFEFYCNRYSRNGLVTFYAYIKSSMKRHTSHTFISYTKFFIRCLINQIISINKLKY